MERKDENPILGLPAQARAALRARGQFQHALLRTRLCNVAERSEDDALLAEKVDLRGDVLPPLFHKLLARATEAGNSMAACDVSGAGEDRLNLLFSRDGSLLHQRSVAWQSQSAASIRIFSTSSVAASRKAPQA